MTTRRLEGPDDPFDDPVKDDDVIDGLPPFGTEAFELPFDSLDESVPLLLLPVRIETRFRPDPNPTQLLVRIYPDQIHIERDVPPATLIERDLAIDFWTEWHGAGDPVRRATAWRRLADATGQRRAGQLVDAFRPTGRTGGPLEFPGPPPGPLPGPSDSATPRPARAALLPRQWVVTGYDTAGAVLFQRGSRTVATDLHTGPSAGAPTWDVAASGVMVDDALAWMVDYDRAVEAGMAVTIALTGSAAAATDGVATLIVTGVNAELDRSEAAASFTAVLESHRATDGLAFVPQGTPTNNTDDLVAGWTAQPNESVPTTASTAGLPGAPDNATRFARLLGLGDGSRWRSMPSGSDTEFDDSQAMRIAMFEVVLGVLARQLLDVGDEPAVDDSIIDQAREWFIDHVTGGAPVPSIRVGAQPYGILPVRAALADPDLGTVVGRVEQITELLAADWRLAIAAVPTIDHGATDSSTDLPVESAIATILATQPHPARLRWRRLESYDSLSDLEHLLTPQFVYELVIAAMNPQTNPALESPYSQVSSLYWAFSLGNPLDTIERQIQQWQEVEEEFPDWMASEGADDPDDAAADFIDVVQSLLSNYANRQYPLQHLDLDRLGTAFAHDTGLAVESPINTNIVQAILYDSTDEWGDAGVIEVPDAPATHSAANYLEQLRRTFDTRNDDFHPIIPLNEDFRAHPPLLYQLLADTVSLVPHVPAAEERFSDALDRLSGLDADALEWLFRETLGLGTHRLDAWHTSIATARLDLVRASQPAGLQIGAFGLVTDLQPSAADGPSQGFVHAPSMAQAGTAAMLRSGWLAHGDADPLSAFAIDLSSRRVRDARWLLDGISEGQPLGDLLGQRFERALHDAGDDRFIRPTRQAVLTAQGRPDASADQPVDGIDLLDLVRARTVELGARATAALGTVEAAFDATNDVAIAEGVHQLAAGNYGRASAMLDAVATGSSRPPDAEVLRTHRRGTSIEHRVAVLLPDVQTSKPVNGWIEGLRDRIAPLLETFVASLLPPPADVGFLTSGKGALGAMSLADLRLSALDAALLVADDPAQTSAAFDTLVTCLSKAPAAVSIDAHTPGDRPISLAEFGVLAVEIRRLLDRSRVGDVRDLRPAADAGESTNDTSAAHASIDALVADFARAVGELLDQVSRGGGAGLTEAVEALARFGLACPGDPNDTVAAQSLLVTAQDRLRQLTGGFGGPTEPTKPGPTTPRRAPGPVPPADPGGPTDPSTPDPWIAPTDEQRVALLFSRRVPIVGTFELAGSSTPEAVAAPDPALADAADVDEWLDAVGRVRAEIGRLTHVGLLADTISGRAYGALAGQHPRLEGEGWVATSRPTNPGGRLAVTVILGPPAVDEPAIVPAIGDRVGALVLDRWVEQIPAPEQISGVAFHYDAPSNQAPQACLLAVTSEGQSWSLDLVLATVLETLDWIRMRAVAPEDLVVAGRSIPSTFVSGTITPWTDPIGPIGPPGPIGTDGPLGTDGRL